MFVYISFSTTSSCRDTVERSSLLFERIPVRQSPVYSNPAIWPRAATQPSKLLPARGAATTQTTDRHRSRSVETKRIRNPKIAKKYSRILRVYGTTTLRQENPHPATFHPRLDKCSSIFSSDPVNPQLDKHVTIRNYVNLGVVGDRDG